jgi:hypothetical protein
VVQPAGGHGRSGFSAANQVGAIPASEFGEDDPDEDARQAVARRAALQQAHASMLRTGRVYQVGPWPLLLADRQLCTVLARTTVVLAALTAGATLAAVVAARRMGAPRLRAR